MRPIRWKTVIDLSEANLTGARLAGADLTRADLNGADDGGLPHEDVASLPVTINCGQLGSAGSLTRSPPSLLVVRHHRLCRIIDRHGPEFAHGSIRCSATSNGHNDMASVTLRVRWR